MSYCHIDLVRGSIILIFGFGGRDVADGLRQPTIVEPIDLFERGVLDSFEAAPGSAPADHLGFVEAVDRFGQSVVVAVADTGDRWLVAGLGKALCVLAGHVLRPTVAIMDQATPKSRTAIVERPFESRTKLACAVRLERFLIGLNHNGIPLAAVF